MAVYIAELEYTTVLTIRVVIDDDQEPTDKDVLESAAYVDNHLDSWVSEETITSIEPY
jgi:hypothetical protein